MYRNNYSNPGQNPHQLPENRPDPDGYKLTITIEDRIKPDGKKVFQIHTKTVRNTDHETPAYRASKIISDGIEASLGTIAEAAYHKPGKDNQQ